jgi:Kef-type K+ transport system membrane component KefB
MPWYKDIPLDLVWPVGLILAWWAGEWLYAWLRIPKISVYAGVGFLLGGGQAGWLPAIPGQGIELAAHAALGLILFEFGHRISLGWLRRNPWLLVIAAVESASIFAVVHLLCGVFGVHGTAALLVAAVSMASSPAILLRVVVAERCRGQVTERSLHIAAVTTVLAIFVFKALVGLAVLEQSGDWRSALWLGLVSLALASVLGIGLALLMRGVAYSLRRAGSDTTLGLAIAVILLVAVAITLDVSPIVAAMSFGLASRQLRLYPGHLQHGFGSFGELSALLLFVLVGSLVGHEALWVGAALGGSLVAARVGIRVVVNGVLAPASGLSWQRGALVGLAMSPFSAMVVLLLEQTRQHGLELLAQAPPLAMAVLLMEVFGPVLTLLAFRAAREASDRGVR